MSTKLSLVADLLSGDEARAEAAVSSLARQGPAALDPLLPLLVSPEAEARWWAVRATAAIPGPRSAAALTAALDDDDPAVRQAAALGLRLQPSREAIAPLARRLSDPDTLTARLASDALAAHGEPALPALRLAVAEPDRRTNAIRAMALMKTPTAIPDLFAALEDPSALVRHWAERGLEDLGVGMVFFSPGQG
jgi:HEAT repeat protein